MTDTNLKADATKVETAVTNADSKAVAWVKAHASAIVIGAAVVVAVVIYKIL